MLNFQTNKDDNFSRETAYQYDWEAKIDNMENIWSRS